MTNKRLLSTDVGHYPVLDSVIDQTQTAFVPDGQIVDNVVFGVVRHAAYNAHVPLICMPTPPLVQNTL